MGKKPTYSEIEKELKNLKRAYAQYRRRHEIDKTSIDALNDMGDFTKSYIANLQYEIEQLESKNEQLKNSYEELLNQHLGINKKKWWQIF